MKLQNRSDGPRVIRESFVLLRTASVTLICLLPGLVYWLAHENARFDTKGTGWVALFVSLFCLVGTIPDDRRFDFDALSNGDSFDERMENISVPITPNPLHDTLIDRRNR